jgi:RimJ/RimL family protein N-acetyltransferase
MINGKRVKLRQLERKHFPLVLKWRNDPEIMKHFFEAAPISEEQQNRWFDKELTTGNFNWVIVADMLEGGAYAEPQIVGTVGMYGIDYRNRKCSWGRLILDPVCRGRKMGIETELLVYKYAFEHLGMNKVYGEALVSNETILKIHEKTGNVVEGVLKQHVYKDGKFHDLAAVAIFADTYFRLKEEGHYDRLLAPKA